MSRILFLDNSIENDVYQPSTYWEPLFLFPFDLYRASAGELPPKLDDYSHIFSSGSSASVLDSSGWMLAEMDLIRTAADQGKVVLGSCFGHQIIARTFFGADAVRRRAVPEVGWPKIEIVASDDLLGASGRMIYGFVFHYDEVCRLPSKEARLLARSAQCEILAFKLNGKPVWGIQPHFEMGIVEGLKLIAASRGDGMPDKRSFFDAADHRPKDSGWVIPLMKAFHETRPVQVH